MEHHVKELGIKPSTYDPCFLISTEDMFRLVGMQTDDTLILDEIGFSEKEEKRLKFNAQPKKQLSLDTPLQFNGAYLASICQPEACYEHSVAAQIQNPSRDHITKLNGRLSWQKNNLERGLKNVPLDLKVVKLYVFVDASFANNADLSSQIGFVIVLANEIKQENHKFSINGNFVHYSSTKSKRVTRSVLASEVYGMVGGVDMGYAIATTINLIFSQLKLPDIPMIVCTDSYSLYECLVKLGTTKEKRLMIDIMALRQSYERRELYEIRWIKGLDNPADAMTKGNPNKALETLIDKNNLEIKVEGWVKRE
ncbi:hypothetical protein K3495_g6346 [Podosphaera aphanis]|nr:hypothetical protein K3495_g6346 [Podosphaera aphanis]